MRGRLVYRAFDLLTGRRVVAAFDRLVELQSRGSAVLETYAAARLSELLQHAIRRVPYYRESLGADRSPSLRSFPLLDKGMLRAAGGRLIADGSRTESMRRATSGGSTGEPVTVYMDREALDAQSAAVLRHQLWMGLEPVEPHLLLWGPPAGVVSYGRLSGRLRGLLLRRRFVHTFDLDDARLPALRAAIDSGRFRQVIGYSSVLDRLASGAAPLDHPPRAVVAAAEVLYPPQRRRIERFFRAPLFERYGCNEFATLAHGCRAGKLHVNTDRLVLEVVDRDGREVPAGGIGEAVVTDLDNRGMPLIRYRLGDALEAGGRCSCGLPYPTIAAIHGRIGDLLTGVDGAQISPRHVACALEACGTVNEHQVFVTRDGTFTVAVRGSGAIDAARAKTALTPLLGDRLRVEIRERLVRWASGKVRPVLREGPGP